MVAPAATELTGSWHNSGYYGHYRSRIRNDFMNEYRQKAKPQPPQKYLDRSRAPVRRHVFSKHDNRERYKDNALYFADGNGRRQVHKATVNYKPEFIAWMPHKKEIIDKRQPLTSVYRENFHSGAGGDRGNPHAQLYSKQIASQAPLIRQKTEDVHKNQGVFNDSYPTDTKNHFTTTYRKIHCTSDPRKEEAREINTICYQSANSQMLERARSVGPAQLRESVASCLSWATRRPQTSALPNTEQQAKISRSTTDATPLIPPSASNQLASVTQPTPGPAALVC
ncbi:uncharacterized protein [Watersipora subatra]|uniref:uncharacterized protein n=1 Tax=Watersipora subatra TaxID=2589382 RepID=UPI00355B7384